MSNLSQKKLKASGVTRKPIRGKSQKQIQYELDEFAEFLLDLFDEKKEQAKQNPLQLVD